MKVVPASQPSPDGGPRGQRQEPTWAQGRRDHLPPSLTSARTAAATLPTRCSKKVHSCTRQVAKDTPGQPQLLPDNEDFCSDHVGGRFRARCQSLCSSESMAPCWLAVEHIGRETEQALTPEGGRGRLNLRPKHWLHGAPSESTLIDEFSSTGS